MKTLYLSVVFISALLFTTQGFASQNSAPSSLDLSKLSQFDLDWIADRIYKNETNRQTKYLTHWNEGEEFPSFGIGHFIWLPDNAPVTFQQTFPQMVRFVSKEVPAPKWLLELQPFFPPWKDREYFYQVWLDEDLNLLRNWLEATKSQQADFIVGQLQIKFNEKLAYLPAEKVDEINQKIQKLSGSKLGMFLIVDYYNFKGLGFNIKEAYQGKGWGLLDIIMAMPFPYTQQKDYEIIFVDYAKKLLQRRIELSPEHRNEQRWRAGWFKRLDNNLLAKN